MRADKRTAGALDTQIGFPDRDLEGDIAFFPLGGAHGVCAIVGHLADGDRIAIAVDHLAEDFLHEHRSFSGNRQTAAVAAAYLGGVCHLVKVSDRLINSFEVFANNRFALLAVGFLDGMLDLCQSFLAR